MIEGSDKQSGTDCKKWKPLPGMDPTKTLSLVRNPDYDEGTDSTEVRENFIDGYQLNINTNENDIFNRVESGDIQVALGPTPQVIRKYSTNPDLKPYLHIDSGDRTWYVTMNLSMPPFDDVNVRKAVNYVMDKDGMQRAWGGPSQGDIATHIVPDTMLNGLLDDYDPYASANHAGDVDAAKAAMKDSKYDSDGDGVCDDPVCKDVLHITRNSSPWTEMTPIEDAALGKIGITLQSRELADAYPPIQDVTRDVPIASVPGWGKDYADVYTFIGALFDGRNILCTGNLNYSLVGISDATAKECDVDLPADGIPSVDADIDACIAIANADERVQCWADLDKKLMEEVVPWVPYLDAKNLTVTSSTVTKWEFDQFSGEPAWSHLAMES
jgi:peptide/nickel transport system substrate-binding protein